MGCRDNNHRETRETIERVLGRPKQVNLNPLRDLYACDCCEEILSESADGPGLDVTQQGPREGETYLETFCPRCVSYGEHLKPPYPLEDKS